MEHMVEAFISGKIQAFRNLNILCKRPSVRDAPYCTSQGSAKGLLSPTHFSTKGTPFSWLYVAPPHCPTETAGELPVPAASPQPCWGRRSGGGSRGSSCSGTESPAGEKEGRDHVGFGEGEISVALLFGVTEITFYLVINMFC